jgi:antitoxin component of RelBE/YafQ-DinJ toxin-antitoxin module
LGQAFPLELKLPNAETQKVIKESSERKNLKTFETKEELMEDLGI